MTIRRVRTSSGKLRNSVLGREGSTGNTLCQQVGQPLSALLLAAETPLGTICLSVDTLDLDDDTPDAIAHAVYLGAIENQVCFLEDWLDVSLPLEPVTMLDPSLACLLTLSPISEQEGEQEGEQKNKQGVTVSLHLAATAWPRVPLIPDHVDASRWHIEWQKHPAKILFARLSPSVADLQVLTNGSVVLIPDSFGPKWNASLELCGHGLTLQGHIDPSDSRWWRKVGIVDDDALADEQSTDVSSLATVVLSMDFKVSSDLLVAGDRLFYREVKSLFEEPVCHLELGSGIRMNGSLIPVAKGYGLYLHRTDSVLRS